MEPLDASWRAESWFLPAARRARQLDARAAEAVDGRLALDDDADGSAMVGACDLTLLPAGGPKRSREGLVADVPAQLALDPDADHFLYLTGMVVPGRMRRRGVGRALLAQSERLAAKMRPRPRCVALHVSKKNDAAQPKTVKHVIHTSPPSSVA